MEPLNKKAAAQDDEEDVPEAFPTPATPSSVIKAVEDLQITEKEMEQAETLIDNDGSKHLEEARGLSRMESTTKMRSLHEQVCELEDALMEMKARFD